MSVPNTVVDSNSKISGEAEITGAAENPFLVAAALKFLLNMLRVQKSRLRDPDFFSVVDKVVTRECMLELVQRSCSNDFLEESASERQGPDRLNLHADHTIEIIRVVWNRSRSQTQFRSNLIQTLEGKLAEYADLSQRTSGNNLLHCRLTELFKLFALGQAEADILMLAYVRYAGIWDPYVSVTSHRVSPIDKLKIIGEALHLSTAQCSAMLSNNDRLRKYALIEEDFDLNPRLDPFLSGLSKEPLASNYFEHCSDASLPWSMHGKLAQQHGETLKTLLKARPSDRGFHILLYGEPGTGKSSFAHSLAAESGLDLYRIKKGDESRANPECNPRIVSLAICADQVNCSRSLLLIDEADKMLSSTSSFLGALLGKNSDTGDKGVINTVMDTLKAACIWITNTSPEALHPSIRRRFDYSIRFDKLSRQQRAQVWKNAVGRYHLDKAVDEALIARLADRYTINAGGIDLALRNCARVLNQETAETGKAEELLHKLLKPHCQLLNIDPDRNDLRITGKYSLEGLNVKGQVSPSRILEAVQRFRQRQEDGLPPVSDAPRMNVLLSGPPGAGKTEFVKYLGHTLNYTILTRMGGDFLDKYVGGTEENIRRAFTEAEADRAILFIDEADGMFRSRQLAGHSWEITQVNELLHAMENFNGVLICATNFADHLDPATLRRFTFKLEFDYLNALGKLLFYQRMFAELCNGALSDNKKRQLTRIDCLTPGDFRTVRQAFCYLGTENISHDDLLAALEQESLAQQQHRPSGRGFGFRL